MPIPLSQGIRVLSYIMKQKIKRVKRYPLVLMLEPLFMCNLECKGCGKIQYPKEILQKKLSVKKCLDAAEECGAPVVSIPGGEPLIHPEIKEIVEGLIAQKRYIYLCTNAILLEKKLHLFKPSKHLILSIHLDGPKEVHDKMVNREGIFDRAINAIKAAKAKGFYVMTNTTLFEGEDPKQFRQFFDYVTNLGIDGMMISPGYSYEKASDQTHFLRRENSTKFFTEILSNPKKKWYFNQSPFFIDFLMGKKNYECTPWGNPTRNIFGWQKPCYLLEGEGHAKTFKELMEKTDWENYGSRKNPKCSNCMVHCGYEPSAVIDSFSSIGKFIQTVKASI